uniref:Ubiquitin fusion degradation protein UFD1 N-terminal subdomain 1 domain-containing protein n=1 Tax=Sphaeramia orbicularis TaxID=375764 RepID=A0A673C9P4_9TELE
MYNAGFVPQFSFHVYDHPMARGFQNRFSTQYRCYSVSMLAGPNDRSDVEKGGKIIMPPSALDQLSRLNITYPMLFKYLFCRLENALRNFACLTTGDVIAINYNEKVRL